MAIGDDDKGVADTGDSKGQSPPSRIDRQRTSRMKTTIKLGDPLEYRVARYLLHRGYVVRRGRAIYTVGYLDQATDLDVYAIRYLDSCRREVIIAECKSGKEGPLDRVFWLSGVRQHVRADEAFLVRRPTKWNIKDFAKENDVKILTTDKLEEIERLSGMDIDVWPGLSDMAFWRQELPEWNKILAEDRYLSEVYFSLVGEVSFDEPFGAVNFLVHHLRALTKEHTSCKGARMRLIRYLLAEAVAQLALFLTQIVCLVMDLAREERKGFILKKLTYGELNVALAERILDHARNLTKQATSHYLNAPLEIDESLFSMPTPDFTHAVIEFIDSLAANALVVGTLAPFVDLLLAESFVKQTHQYEVVVSVFRSPDYEERKKQVRQFIELLVGLDCLPPAVQDMYRLKGEANSGR